MWQCFAYIISNLYSSSANLVSSSLLYRLGNWGSVSMFLSIRSFFGLPGSDVHGLLMDEDTSQWKPSSHCQHAWSHRVHLMANPSLAPSQLPAPFPCPPPLPPWSGGGRSRDAGQGQMPPESLAVMISQHVIQGTQFKNTSSGHHFLVLDMRGRSFTKQKP